MRLPPARGQPPDVPVREFQPFRNNYVLLTHTGVLAVRSLSEVNRHDYERAAREDSEMTPWDNAWLAKDENRRPISPHCGSSWLDWD